MGNTARHNTLSNYNNDTPQNKNKKSKTTTFSEVVETRTLPVYIAPTQNNLPLTFTGLRPTVP